MAKDTTNLAGSVRQSGFPCFGFTIQQRKHHAVILGLFLFFFLQVAPFSVAEENKGVSVTSVVITGAKNIDEKLIRQTMLTKGKDLFSLNEVPLDEEIMEGDLERIRELYHSAGYYDVKVTYSLGAATGEKGQVAKVVIEEGEPVRVASILIDSPIWPDWLDKALDGRGEGELRSGTSYRNLLLNEGAIFNALTYNHTKKQLLDIFAKNGYGQVSVQGQARVYRQEHNVDIRLTVRPGRLFRVGEIRIKGNERLAPHLITREMDITAGEGFSSAKLASDQRKLLGLDYFRVVKLEPLWNESDEEHVPILVNVEEKPPRSAEFGIGYGTEEQLRIRSGIRWRNFLGDGYQLKLSGKVSGLGHSIETRFSDSYFLNRRDLALLYKLGYEVLDLESYSNTKYYSTVQVNKSLTPQLRLSFIHNLEENETTQLPATISLKTIERYGTYEEKSYFISSLGGEVSWNTLDNLLDPSHGLYLAYEMEAAADLLGSQVDFLRQDIRAHCYIHMQDRMVLALRSSIGSIAPLQASAYIPIARRFFSGGSDSVRGYDYQELGEKDSQGKSIGGNSVLEGSVELRFPLKDELSGVVFCDAGNIYTGAYTFDFNELRYAAGLGLRYHTIIGPIRLDAAYQLNPQDENDSRYRIHLNFGEVF